MRRLCCVRQGAGNHSNLITNGGAVSVSVMLFNVLNITTSGAVSGIALFIGLPVPTKDFKVPLDGEYSEPALIINGRKRWSCACVRVELLVAMCVCLCLCVTEDGDVTILVAGASPLDANATDYEMINVYTTSGDIKVCNHARLQAWDADDVQREGDLAGVTLAAASGL